MNIYGYKFSKKVSEFMRVNYKNRGYSYEEFDKLDEILASLKEEGESALIIIEARFVDLEEVEKIRKLTGDLLVMGLFAEDGLEELPCFINSKSIDYIDYLPLRSSEIIDRAIEDVLKLKYKEEKNIYRKLQKDKDLKDIFTLKYIYDLIYGYVSEKDLIEDITEMLGLRNIPNVVLTLEVDDFWDTTMNYNNKQKYHIKHKILNLLEEFIDEENAVACSLIGTDKLIILLDYSDYPEEVIDKQIVKTANMIRRDIRENSNYTVTLGIGKVYNSYENLWKSYEESFQAVSSSFGIGNDTLVHYDEIKPLKIDQLKRYDFSKYEFEFFKSLSRNDKEEILKAYDSLFDIFLEKKYSNDIIRPILYKFIYEVLEYYRDLGLDKKILSHIGVETMIHVSKASSINKTRSLVKEMIFYLSEEYIKLTSSINCEGLNCAVAFLEKNYYKDISLDDVSYTANMSPSYFSRQFKKEYGVNFVNFLQNLRVEKSKELLTQTNLSIQDIAFEVGFKDTAHFSKSFKSINMIPPSKYRKTK